MKSNGTQIGVRSRAQHEELSGRVKNSVVSERNVKPVQRVANVTGTLRKALGTDNFELQFINHIGQTQHRFESRRQLQLVFGQMEW